MTVPRRNQLQQKGGCVGQSSPGLTTGFKHPQWPVCSPGVLLSLHTSGSWSHSFPVLTPRFYCALQTSRALFAGCPPLGGFMSRWCDRLLDCWVTPESKAVQPFASLMAGLTTDSISLGLSSWVSFTNCISLEIISVRYLSFQTHNTLLLG